MFKTLKMINTLNVTYGVQFTEIRSDNSATCTAGEPVSPDFLEYVLITSALRAVVIDIVYLNLSFTYRRGL